MTNNTNDVADGWPLTSDGRSWGEITVLEMEEMANDADGIDAIKEMFDKLRPRTRRALVAYLMHTTDLKTGERIPE